MLIKIVLLYLVNSALDMFLYQDVAFILTVASNGSSGVRAMKHMLVWSIA